MNDSDIERSNFVDRLSECREKFGSVNAYAVAAGLNPTTVHGYFKDREPTRPTLVALAKAAGVNVQWLVAGEGPKLVKSREECSSEGPMVTVPIHSVRASTGYGAAVFDRDEEPEAEMAFERNWLRRITSAGTDRLGLIYANGDSMEPEIRGEDLLLIDRSANEVTTEGIYAVSFDNFLQVKFVRQPNPETLELISLNEVYKPVHINLKRLGELVRIVGRVIWVARRT